jgi:hypothetical protein
LPGQPAAANAIAAIAVRAEPAEPAAYTLSALRERNTLLAAAGFAAVYRETALDATALPGTASASASVSTISRLGLERPVSRKLRWRPEIPASIARASWLFLRAVRQALSKGPTVVDWPSIVADMLMRIPARQARPAG